MPTLTMSSGSGMYQNQPPLEILKIGGVLMNFALGGSALHALYINRTLLPRELRPNWFMQLGIIICGLFFFAISGIVLVNLVGKWT